MTIFNNIYERISTSKLFNYDILILLAILICLIIFTEIIKFLCRYYEKMRKVFYAYYGYISKEYLIENLNHKQFEKWCMHLMTNMGLKDIVANHDFSIGSANIKGVFDESKVYISSIFTEKEDIEFEDIEFEEENDEYLNITKNDVRAFTGNLISNNINHGIIFTTGKFTPEAKKYAKSLSKLNIELVDGDNLVSKFIQHNSKFIKSSIVSKKPPVEVNK